MCSEMSFPVVQVDSHVLGGLQVETKNLLTTKAPAECSPNTCGIGETSPSYYFLKFKAYSGKCLSQPSTVSLKMSLM